MIVCLLLLLVGGALGLGAVLLRKMDWGETTVSPWLAVAVGGPLVGLAVGYVIVEALAPPGEGTPAPKATILLPSTEGELQGPADSPVGPLAVGVEAPDFEAEGWLNGPPPIPGPEAPRVIVVDLWANWCPGCREMAPALVQAFQKYKDRQVEFVSLTNMSRDSVERFVKRFRIPWASGYEVSLSTIAAFGAYGRDRPIAGYEVTPTVYLLGAKGRILWNDRNARMRHDATPEARISEYVQELEAQIERALAAESLPRSDPRQHSSSRPGPEQRKAGDSLGQPG